MFSAAVLPIQLLKKDRYVVEHILWDYEPRLLMQPRCRKDDEGTKSIGQPAGYIVYIETMDKKPGLFLMIQTSSGCAETIAKIGDIPDEMLAEAVFENKDKMYFGMYPVNRKLKDWLRKELGVQEL